MTEETKTQTETSGKTATEHVEVLGGQLVDKVKEIVAEGNVRRLIFRTPDDKVVLEMTLTTGALMGGVFTLAAPWLAALGAIAALVARIRIEVVREVKTPEVVQEPEQPSSTGKQKVKIEVDD
jgi:hypothetical protein